jgi:hypothetical protein
MQFKWHIDTKALQEYLETKLDRPSPEAIRKYFKGFNKMTQDHMFKEEIADVERMYATARQEMSEKADSLLPAMISYMRRFIEAYDAVVAIDEKVEALNAKLGRDTCKTCCRED